MLPNFLRQFFWYTDNDKMDKVKDGTRIIMQILEYGDKKALTWLFKNYDQQVIRSNVINRGVGELGKKSLNYWCFILEINSSELKKTRF